MKRIWMVLAMAFAIATVSIPEGMGQVRSDEREAVTLKRIWSDPEGTFVNVTNVKLINRKIFAGTVGGYLRVSSDTGKTWIKIGRESGLDLDLGIVSSIAEVDSGHILVGGADWIYRSTNGGMTWTKARYLRNDIKDAVIFRTREGVLFAGGWGMLRSDDNGWTWKQVLGDSLIWVERMVQMPSGRIIIGLNAESVPGYGGGIIVSDDGGKNWSYSNYGLPDHKDITGLAAASFGDSRKVYASIYDRGIYVSEDEGLNWRAAPGISGVWAETVAMFPTLGTFAGFSPSANNPEQLFKENGSTWSPVGFAGKALSVLSLGALGPSQLLVGTSDGLWLATFQIVATPVEEDGKMPSVFSLSQNYPNPFNPRTTIQFSLPKRSNVSITIWNTIGQKIETLVDGEMESGIHRIVWNAGKYPSGIYWYRLETSSGFVSTKKMLLVK